MFEKFQNGVIQSGAQSRAAVDAGLRSYLLRVYNYMAMGLGLTAVVAFLVSTSPAMMNAIFGSPLYLVALFAPVGLALYLQFRIQHLQVSTAQMLFWVYAGLMGISLSYILIVYEMTSVMKVFFITAGTFAAMSLYGYTTQKDLSRMGSFLIMGLFGLIIASVVNMFFKSSSMDFIISLLGVAIFIGLTAYDTQNIKNSYYEFDGAEVAGKKAVLGALRLYLDFINLFLYMLRFLGDRR